MGKSAKFKKLRRLALQLPAIETKRVVGEKILGQDVKDTEIPEGMKINPLLTYRRKKLVTVPLNHSRNLKRAYMKQGMQGAAMYSNAVNAYVKSKTAAATGSASK